MSSANRRLVRCMNLFPARALTRLVPQVRDYPPCSISSHRTDRLPTALVFAFIVLLGSSETTAIHIAAQVYLRGFQFDAKGNLLAREHVAQVGILKPRRRRCTSSNCAR